MKAEYINPFLASTIRLFERTFFISPKPGDPYLMKNFGNHRWEISGVMALTGKASGVISIRLTRFLSMKLLEKAYVSYDTEEEREDLVNGMVEEIVNVIAGNAATSLHNYDIQVSVPFVVQGPNHSIAWPQKAPVVCVPFSTPHGPFLVSLSMSAAF